MYFRKSPDNSRVEGSQEAEGSEAGRFIESESQNPRQGLIKAQVKSREMGFERRVWKGATYFTESLQLPWHPTCLGSL